MISGSIGRQPIPTPVLPASLALNTPTPLQSKTLGPQRFGSVAAFSHWYAGKIDLSDPPPGMAPGRAKNLTGVAPAYIGVVGHDPLRDDGIHHSELLAAAGVPVEVHNAETMVRG